MSTRSWLRSLAKTFGLAPESHTPIRRPAGPKAPRVLGGVEQLEHRVLPATALNNLPVTGSIDTFGETNTAYYAQSFIAPGPTGQQVQAQQLMFELENASGPDATEFHVLLTTTTGGTEASNPTAIR